MKKTLSSPSPYFSVSSRSGRCGAVRVASFPFLGQKLKIGCNIGVVDGCCWLLLLKCCPEFVEFIVSHRRLFRFIGSGGEWSYLDKKPHYRTNLWSKKDRLLKKRAYSRCVWNSFPCTMEGGCPLSHLFVSTREQRTKQNLRRLFLNLVPNT